jgi:hypothetical protein
MQKLLSVPPAVQHSAFQLRGRSVPEWFWTCDPPGQKLGSGGGTAFLVADAWRQTGGGQKFCDWAGREKRLIIHAGGQSRRLPAYAACGKALVPVPVYRWARGQRIDQTLLDLQLPLLERLLGKAPPHLRWLVASGDVLIRADIPARLPEADVLVCGLWGEADLATRHGVFFSSRSRPEELLFMRQKPSIEELRNLSPDYLFQIDIGIWLFSDAAFDFLLRSSGLDPETGEWIEGGPLEYDLYGDFGLRLGGDPTHPDEACARFSSACVPLPGGTFYHFGRTEDLIHSSVELQNVVTDLREIQMRNIKPNADIFVQNADTRGLELSNGQRLLWIENATVGSGWKLGQRHVLTGVPPNDWRIEVPPGICLDFVPVVREEVALRPYGFSDSFREAVGDCHTHWMEQPIQAWLKNRGLRLDELGLDPEVDLQDAKLFPVFAREALSENFVCWMVAAGELDDPESREIYLRARRLSASELGTIADLDRLQAQRQRLLLASVPLLMKNARRSVFYQIDLKHAAGLWKNPDAPELPDEAPSAEKEVLSFVHDRMFRFEVQRHRGSTNEELERSAFGALQKHLVESVASETPAPVISLLADQIVWGRSPVRLDFAGGWTDTAPYCLLHGGSVVNAAVELNGQPPIQVFARLCDEPVIVLRSIDLGESATIRTYADVGSYAKVGSGFSIPKAAFALAGFHPAFQAGVNYGDLKTQLRSFGGGIEL